MFPLSLSLSLSSLALFFVVVAPPRSCFFMPVSGNGWLYLTSKFFVYLQWYKETLAGTEVRDTKPLGERRRAAVSWGQLAQEFGPCQCHLLGAGQGARIMLSDSFSGTCLPSSFWGWVKGELAATGKTTTTVVVAVAAESERCWCTEMCGEFLYGCWQHAVRTVLYSSGVVHYTRGWDKVCLAPTERLQRASRAWLILQVMAEMWRDVASGMASRPLARAMQDIQASARLLDVHTKTIPLALLCVSRDDWFFRHVDQIELLRLLLLLTPEDTERVSECMDLVFESAQRALLDVMRLYWTVPVSPRVKAVYDEIASGYECLLYSAVEGKSQPRDGVAGFSQPNVDGWIKAFSASSTPLSSSGIAELMCELRIQVKNLWVEMLIRLLGELFRAKAGHRLCGADADADADDDDSDDNGKIVTVIDQEEECLAE